MVELLCPSGTDRLARLNEGRIEIRCTKSRCKARGTVVFHYYDAVTGAFIETKRYRDPAVTAAKPKEAQTACHR